MEFLAHLGYSKYVSVYRIPSLLKERYIHQKRPTFLMDMSLLTWNFMHTSAHLRYSKYVITVDIFYFIFLGMYVCKYFVFPYLHTYIHSKKTYVIVLHVICRYGVALVSRID